MIEADHPRLSIVRQCELVAISRSGFYHRPAGESTLNLELMPLIDKRFMATPEVMDHARWPSICAVKAMWWGPQTGAPADGQDRAGADLPAAPNHGSTPRAP
jgi:hypothetical protein